MADWGRAQDVARNRRHARRAPRLRRGGGRLWLARLAIAGACLALSGSADAAVGERPSAVHGVGMLVSPQYQAKNADTALAIGPHGPAADPFGGDAPRVAARADLTGRVRRAASSRGWYRVRALQYQFHGDISGLPKGRIARTQIGSGHLNPQATYRSIAPQIHQEKVISNSKVGLDSQDARRLLQLGVFLGLVYVLFVVFWLWRTRNRPHAADRVVRY